MVFPFYTPLPSRFVGKPIAIRDALERVLPAAAGERKTHGELLHMVG
jgi:hypothetical protein